MHRIDRDTSGLVVFARSARAQEALKQQFIQHQPERVYWAIVYGHVTPTDPGSSLGAQVGTTLSFAGPRPAGVETTGEVGVVASATSAVVNASVTNFEIDD